MNEMNITSAQYLRNDNNEIIATIDGTEFLVPASVGNRHYEEIMRQVEAEELTIAPAEGG